MKKIEIDFEVLFKIWGKRNEGVRKKIRRKNFCSAEILQILLKIGQNFSSTFALLKTFLLNFFPTIFFSENFQQCKFNAKILLKDRCWKFYKKVEKMRANVLLKNFQNSCWILSLLNFFLTPKTRTHISSTMINF